MNIDVERVLEWLVNEGGQIVSAADCSTAELIRAAEEGRSAYVGSKEIIYRPRQPKEKK